MHNSLHESRNKAGWKDLSFLVVVVGGGRGEGHTGGHSDRPTLYLIPIIFITTITRLSWFVKDSISPGPGAFLQKVYLITSTKSNLAFNIIRIFVG